MSKKMWKLRAKHAEAKLRENPRSHELHILYDGKRYHVPIEKGRPKVGMHIRPDPHDGHLVITFAPLVGVPE